MRKVQLIITDLNDVVRYEPIDPARGWKYETMYGVELLTIGNGLHRKFYPLCNVRSVQINQYQED